MNLLTREKLVQLIKQGESFEYILFWGGSKSSPPDKSCLSQWYKSPFTVKNIQYPTAEHWMMAEKARLFNDQETLRKILDASSPKEAKTLGRLVRGFDANVWKQNCKQIVAAGNYHKFTQDAELKDYLLSTNNNILVEASPYDKIWGIGLSDFSLDARNPDRWNGSNYLGFVLMYVRELLKAVK